MWLVPKRLARAILVVNGVLAVIVVARISQSEWWHSRRYERIIRSAARRHGVDPHLIRAVIWQESRFHPWERGRHNEIGLMQVTEAAAREWAAAVGISNVHEKSLFDPAMNIEAGTWYLARALLRWSHCDDPVPYAIAEYNAGYSNARRWYDRAGTNAQRFCESITYPTTRRYVEHVLKDYRQRRGAP